MRAAPVVVAPLLLMLSLGAAHAQPGRRTERLTADLQVSEVVAVPRVLCGGAAAYATLRARVLAVHEGTYEPREIYLSWLSCGASREVLEQQLVGHRFRARLRRWIHPREQALPLARQPRFYVRGQAEPME